MQKKNNIKIPKNVLVIYSSKKKIITLIGAAGTKSLKLTLKLNVVTNSNLIEVTCTPFSQTSKLSKKYLKSMQGTTVSLIKQILIESSSLVYRKLKIVGVGYRAFAVEGFNKKLLLFKLGFSHPIYHRIPDDLNIFSLKFTKLFIYGHSYQNITQTAAIIRLHKKPEPYKGKGILHESEKVILKEGKKI